MPFTILAPMAGVTDIVFRDLCAQAGADLTFTEMISAKGLAYRSQKTKAMLCLGEAETRVGVQLFGHEAEMLAEQAALVEELLGGRLACLDINMGCPAHKIVSKDDGAALMNDPQRAFTIVASVKGAVKNTPITVKMRRGYRIGSENAVEFAKRMEGAGADMVTIHGRYAEQLYRGKADWDVIRRVKEALSIPVCGNGDIKSADDAQRMIEETGCDALMIARGAQGNPWIFTQIHALFDGRRENPPEVFERIEMARRHARMLADHLCTKAQAQASPNIRSFRKHAMWYMAGLPGAAAARERISHCETLEDFENLFDELQAKVSGNDARSLNDQT